MAAISSVKNNDTIYKIKDNYSVKGININGELLLPINGLISYDDNLTERLGKTHVFNFLEYEWDEDITIDEDGINIINNGKKYDYRYVILILPDDNNTRSLYKINSIDNGNISLVRLSGPGYIVNEDYQSSEPNHYMSWEDLYVDRSRILTNNVYEYTSGSSNYKLSYNNGTYTIKKIIGNTENSIASVGDDDPLSLKNTFAKMVVRPNSI